MKIRQQQGLIAWSVSLLALVIAGCSSGSSDIPYAPTGSQYLMTDYLEPRLTLLGFRGCTYRRR